MTINECQLGGGVVYKNKSKGGTNNLCGPHVARARKALLPKTSQQGLAKMLQLEGIDLDKNAIQRIEAGKRYVTDIEVKALAKVLGVTVEELLSD